MEGSGHHTPSSVNKTLQHIQQINKHLSLVAMTVPALGREQQAQGRAREGGTQRKVSDPGTYRTSSRRSFTFVLSLKVMTHRLKVAQVIAMPTPPPLLATPHRVLMLLGWRSLVPRPLNTASPRDTPPP